ncbi:MAG: dephospho-CoA kinase [Gemmatimonadetes bacterium]|nr:dephospho-CoA kinase [Gemmatimonadota bacterium]
MLLVGLTGNIASGKSEVARQFAELGATVIDADLLAREAVAPGQPALAHLRERFGAQVLAPDGTLDRAALRGRVFADPRELDALNAILHPDIGLRRDRLVAAARARGDRIVVCDIPLLFERNLVDDYDVVVLVDAPRAMRLDRLVRDRGLAEAEAMRMIAAQMPAELKRARADIVVDNAGTREALAARVREAWAALVARAERLP